MTTIQLLSKSPLCISVPTTLSLFDAGIAYAEKQRADGSIDRKPLSDLVQLRKATVNPSAEKNQDTIFQYIDLAEVDEVLGAIITYRSLTGEHIGSTKVRFGQGDILFAKIRPSIDNKKVAYVYQDLENAVASTEFIVLTPKPRVSPFYLYAALRSNEFTETVIRTCGGDTGRQRIKTSQLLSLSIPWPERDVRKGIASRFKEFFDSLEEASELQKQALQFGQEALGPTTMRTSEPRRKQTKTG